MNGRGQFPGVPVRRKNSFKERSLFERIHITRLPKITLSGFANGLMKWMSIQLKLSDRIKTLVTNDLFLSIYLFLFYRLFIIYLECALGIYISIRALYNFRTYDNKWVDRWPQFGKLVFNKYQTVIPIVSSVAKPIFHHY